MIRGNSRQGPNITVTQGNQLRNKLSFYRILNRALLLRRGVEFKGQSLSSSRKEKYLVRPGDCSRPSWCRVVARLEGESDDRQIILIKYCDAETCCGFLKLYCYQLRVRYSGKESREQTAILA